MALTEAQKAAVRLYTGWSARFGQWGPLERALAAIEDLPDTLAQITNAINGTPPGLLALLADLDARLQGSLGRLKASKVGSIELNGAETGQLRSRGRQLVTRLCTILDVRRGTDVFGGGGPVDNYVGQ